jgi:hypothetical protein
MARQTLPPIAADSKLQNCREKIVKDPLILESVSFGAAALGFLRARGGVYSSFG